MSDTVLHGDCLTLLKTLPDNSVDSIVTDPPAGIEFMGKDWDSFKQGRAAKYNNSAGFNGTGTGAGRSQDNGDYSWFGSAAQRPNYSLKVNPRCLKCNHYQFSGTPCKCEIPEWKLDHSVRDTFIAFMREVMTEALRVLKPGGHALVWALPRTSHWTATALEDAGFEVRDKLYHLFGSGFPKSTAIDKQIDRLARREYVQAALRLGIHIPGNSLHDWTKAEHSPGDAWWEKFKVVLSPEDWQRIEREVIGQGKHGLTSIWGSAKSNTNNITAPATPEAAQYAGYGTALKPSCEEWILCRKPLAESSIAAQVLATGTGGLNIAQCRVGLNGEKQPTGSGDRRNSSTYAQDEYTRNHMHNGGNTTPTQGRFPSHLLLSHSVFCQPTSCEPDLCPIAELDRQSGVRKSGGPGIHKAGKQGYHGNAHDFYTEGHASEGFASRYFTNFPPDDYTPFLYQSKASRAERNAGCEDLPSAINNVDFGTMQAGGSGKPVNGNGQSAPRGNGHPTVKSTSLMRWLIRLITPPNGIVLDPFCGSGSTCVAAIQEGKHFIGIEQSSEYCDIANARIEYARTHEPDVVQVATKKVKGNDKAHDRHNGDRKDRAIYGDYNASVTQGFADSEGMEEVEDWECAEDCPIRIIGEQSGERKSAYPGTPEKAAQQSHKHYEDIPTKIYGDGLSQRVGRLTSDTGTAARYFQQFPPDSLWCDETEEVGA